MFTLLLITSSNVLHKHKNIKGIKPKSTKILSIRLYKPMSSSSNAWLYILVLSSILITIASSQAHCPAHCSTCLPNMISCTSGGLLSIPIQLQPGTEKIILAGQFQFHGILTIANFSDLAPPKYNILDLSIRSSSIQELRPKTFSKLIHLKYLDLSENQRLTILSLSFEDLQLKHLKLDDIGKLQLMSGCFKGLTTEYLSMKNSRLQTLNYDIFSPISHTLKHLIIENNQIRTLDQSFEPLFYRLESINLKDNPLICYCPLLWLSKALRSKMQSHKYQNSIENGQANAKESNIFPKCVTPSYLRHRQIQTILESEFNCKVPQISQIEIDLASMKDGEMVCKIESENKGHKNPTKVFWQENSILTDTYQRFSRKAQSNNDRIFSEESETRDLPATIKISATPTFRKRNYKCIAENMAGQSSIAVQILWPVNSFLNKTVPFVNDSNFLDKSDISINHQNLNNIPNESYLFTKHYTLLEMTVAIVGTFIITVLIFLVSYKCYFRRKNGYKSGKHSLKYSINGESPNSNKRALMAFHNPRSGYTVYETSMHYSDNSQTYDSIPQNSVYPNQQQPLFPTLTNSPSAHFIDYKTHKNLYPSSPCV